MKHTPLRLLSALALFTTCAAAAPLQRAIVPADSKWLVHLDVETLRKTQSGTALVAVGLEQMGKEFKKQAKIDPEAIIAQTASVTAFGPDFRPGPKGRGVLIWQTGKEIEQVVTGLLIQQAEASKAGEGIVKEVRAGAEPIYAVGGSLYAVVRPGRGILVSPQLEEIDNACRVMDGKSPTLADSPALSGYMAGASGFFVVALAEGFAKDLGLPPQAQVLKQAEGVCVALGEEAEKLKLALILKAPSDQGATQIQQVLQGLVALATLTHVEEPELVQAKEWLSGTQVKQQDKEVSLSLSVPVSAALEHLRKAVGTRTARHAPPAQTLPAAVAH